ncbi:MAG: hypothetical protein ABIQ18_20910 [Umezawaea sp.]
MPTRRTRWPGRNSASAPSSTGRTPLATMFSWIRDNTADIVAGQAVYDETNRK